MTDSVSYGLKKVRYDSYMDGHARGYQHIAKRCPACNVKRDFAPSGAIRVNSQKKLLDIWSI